MYFHLMPSFSEPRLTRPGNEVCEELGIMPPECDAIPHLWEPEDFPYAPEEAGELIEVKHPRILVLENYLHAGWENSSAGAWLRAEPCNRLVQVAESLPEPWGLCVFDAWRPLPLQAELFDTAYLDPKLPEGFVSPPSEDPATPPPHLTGGTVDCSFTLNGIPLDLGTTFDDFTEMASITALENQKGINARLRRWLYWSMRSAGFVVLDCEWWHFEFGTRRWAALFGVDPLYGPTNLT